MMADRLRTWQVRTPEGVAFSFRLASPLLRAVALWIDVAVVGAAWSLISMVVLLLHVLGSDAAGFVQALALFLLSQGYRIAAEWFWNGQTLGKRVMRLRVVDERGFRLTFAQVVLRNILRFLDVLPGAYLVGGIAALMNRRGQRLGDVAAGTLVVWEPRELVPDLASLPETKYNSLRSHPPVIARLRQAATPAVARSAWQALARRERLDPESRIRVFSALAKHFQALTPMPAEVVDGLSDEQFVRNVVDVLFVTRS